MSGKEIWKPVPSLPGVLASSLGRILLPPRYRPMPSGGYRIYAPKPVVGSVSRSSKAARHTYRSVYNADLGHIKVHRAVCEAFHGAPPFDGAIVLHLDEDGHNNRPENLKWGTNKENLNMPKYLAWCSSPERVALITAGMHARSKRRAAT